MGTMKAEFYVRVTFKARQDWFAFNVRLTFSKSKVT